MALTRTAAILLRAGDYELGVCERFNRGCNHRSIRGFFATISRLGDGPLWYALILFLPVYDGSHALPYSLAMVMAGLFGLVCYRFLKHGTNRPRPYSVSDRITLGTAPLDRFSFPSGHTLHAVSFTLIATQPYPEMVPILYPFTLLVALSRIMLGLHYPSDVLAGALLGGFAATVCLSAL
jgi:undecaprenyl-diphosphatase